MKRCLFVRETNFRLFVIMSENKFAKLVIQSKAIEIDTAVGHSSVHNVNKSLPIFRFGKFQAQLLERPEFVYTYSR